MDLLKRRDEIAAENRRLESVRGSGWHVADPGAEQRERAGEPPLSARPIALLDNETVHVVGPDVAPVKAGLQRFLDKLDRARAKAQQRGWDEPDLLGHGGKYQANVVRFARLALSQGDAIALNTQQWNYVNSALTWAGVPVSSALAEVQDYSDV